MHETLLLIAQAVRSDIPLASAIRLTVGEQPDRVNAPLLRLAELLDKGLEPKVAAAQSGLPKPVVDLLDVALGSGDFAGTFDELAKLELRRSLTIHRIVQALAYPMLLLVSCILALGCLLISIAPQFKAMFIDFDSQLPAMTNWVVQLSDFVRSPVSLLGLLVFMLTLYLAAKLLFPRFWLCIPVLGHVGRNLYTARMLRQLANFTARNIPLPEALEECGKGMRNTAYRKDCRSAAVAARKGMSLEEIVMRYYWLFPTWLAPMIAADNNQGTIPKSLRRAADSVEQQQDASLLFLQAVSLPLFIVITISTIGFFVMAMFMPLIRLITDLSM